MRTIVFVDTDVLISSLLSSTGAAFLLLNNIESIQLFVSNFSIEETLRVAEKLEINNKETIHLLDTRLSKIELIDNISEIKTQFSDYVTDINDAHIVAGANQGKVQFIITYNTKHFKSDKIKNDLDIIVTTPANILQYLRSL